jgi:hypothetical protein
LIVPRRRDVLVRWELASEVFNEVTVARFFALTKRTFPGVERLHPNAQAALVSLVFNRGNSLIGERRSEMRAIRAIVSLGGGSLGIITYRANWQGSQAASSLTGGNDVAIVAVPEPGPATLLAAIAAFGTHLRFGRRRATR